MAASNAHPETHTVSSHRIGAGLRRILCSECDYVGVDEAELHPSDLGIMIPTGSMVRSVMRRSTAGDPWAAAA